MRMLFTACALGALAFATGASAQSVKIGFTLSSTGPAASLGIPEANTAKLMVKDLGGTPVEIVILDDGSDTTKGVANARKLLTDDKVDVLVGSSTTPVSLAMIEVAAEQKDPDDHAGRLGGVDLADGRQAPLGVQDAAERQV